MKYCGPQPKKLCTPGPNPPPKKKKKKKKKLGPWWHAQKCPIRVPHSCQLLCHACTPQQPKACVSPLGVTGVELDVNALVSQRLSTRWLKHRPWRVLCRNGLVGPMWPPRRGSQSSVNDAELCMSVFTRQGLGTLAK